MKQVLVRVFFGLAFLFFGVYAVDYLSVRFKIPNRDQFGTVTVQTFLAVPQKDGKTEFIMGDTQDVQCVHSLFPHFDCLPCWYEAKKTSKRIDM
jgi:hypothetical protein